MSSEFDALASDLAAKHATATESDAGARWVFATSMMVGRANAVKKGKEFDACVGKACADAVGRANPYSASWVRQIIAAAVAYPKQPETAADCAAFLEKFNGHSSRTSGASKVYTQAELLGLVGKAVLKAINDGGAVVSQINTAVADAIAKAAVPTGGNPVVGASAPHGSLSGLGVVRA